MSRKGKIAVEEKAKIVRLYLAGQISRAEAARRGGVAPSTLNDWARIYRNEGVIGLASSEKNRVYSPELKKQAVDAYLAGKSSQSDVCEKYGIRARILLRDWIKVYNTHGDFCSVKQSGGGSYMKESRSTTQEERVQIAKDCIANGKNYGEMALKYKVSYQQVRTWTLRFETLGAQGLEDRRGQRKRDQTPRTALEQAQIEIEKLKHENYLLTMERNLLKKLDEIERRDAFRK
ncbi:MAG: transposase [Oscillospiraceae bacterium]